MVADLILPEAAMAMRDWRPSALNSVICAWLFPGSGTLLNAELIPDAIPRLRHTVSAAKYPPGVSVMPLNLSDGGSSAGGAAAAAWGLPPPAGELGATAPRAGTDDEFAVIAALAGTATAVRATAAAGVPAVNR